MPTPSRLETSGYPPRTLTPSHPHTLTPSQSEHMARLVKVPGIVIQASGLRAKATRLTLQCRSCRHIIPSVPVRPGLEGFSLPRRCPADQTGRPKCALDSFFVVPDKCKCVDFQVSLSLSLLSHTHTHHIHTRVTVSVPGSEAAGES